MSAPTIETLATRPPSDSSVEQQLHAELGLSPDQAVMDWNAYNKVHVDIRGRSIPGSSGSMFVEYTVADAEGIKVHHTEVDDTRRPFSEPLITTLGRRAIDNADAVNPQRKRRVIEINYQSA